MTAAAVKTETRDIVIDEVLPHLIETIWKAMTTAELIGRWLMQPTGFEATAGRRFTFQTKPGGTWDGVIHCEVLEVVPNRRLTFAWKSGVEGNSGYGSPLDSVVTWSLTPAAAGTRVRLVHSGFVMPKNDTAYTTMSEGWAKVVQQLDAITSEDGDA